MQIINTEEDAMGRSIQKIFKNGEIYRKQQYLLFVTGEQKNILVFWKNQNNWLIYIKMLLESYYSKRFYLVLGMIPISLSKVLEQHSDTLYSNEHLSRKPILLAILVKKLINFIPSKHVQSKVRNTWSERVGSASYHSLCVSLTLLLSTDDKNLPWASLCLSSVMACCLFPVKVNYNEDF